MTVTLRSPALGHEVGYVYTGPEEAFLLAQGYAVQAGYDGPGVSNTGVADTIPANDLRLAENREGPVVEGEDWHTASGRLDPALIDPGETEKLAEAEALSPAGRYDFDAGGIDDEAPAV